MTWVNAESTVLMTWLYADSAANNRLILHDCSEHIRVALTTLLHA